MIEFSIVVCFIVIGIALLLALGRFLAGPSILDRIIAFDMIAICIVGMIILLSIWWGTPLYIEIMLIFSLLGFVGTIAFVSFLQADPSRLQPHKRKTKKGDETKP